MHPHHEAAIERVVAQLRADPEVKALLLAGSIAHGFQSADSDVDLLIVVSDAERGSEPARFAFEDAHVSSRSRLIEARQHQHPDPRERGRGHGDRGNSAEPRDFGRASAASISARWARRARAESAVSSSSSERLMSARASRARPVLK